MTIMKIKILMGQRLFIAFIGALIISIVIYPNSSSSSGTTDTYPPCSSIQPGMMIPCVDSTVDNTEDPVALWKFDEGSGAITKDSVNDIAGTLINNPTWAPGKFGTALNFDGNATRVNIASALLSNLNTITVSAWVYPRSDGNNITGVRRIVSKGTFGGISKVRFALQLGASGSLQFNAGYTGRNGVWGTPTDAVSLNQWHQVTATYAFGDASVLPAFYVDGVPQQVSVVTYPGSNTPVSDDQMLYIGDRGDGTRVWDGVN